MTRQDDYVGHISAHLIGAKKAIYRDIKRFIQKEKKEISEEEIDR